ncbi:MAG: S49 family peptidase [Desulfovibrio sp.]|nr:S49 family peptidase [Desulfovibrio sp.]
MPNWNTILEEIGAQRSLGLTALDTVRRKYLRSLHDQSGRNIIAYYSGWLQKGNLQNIDITDLDMNGFMNAVHGLDRTKGLDLFLHTPGGNIAAAESIVEYLRRMFGMDIRAIIPQLALSAGTMIACSCKSVLMGKQSSLGPIDPQFGMISARGVKDEFQRAIDEVKADPSKTPIWQAIIGKYHPTFIAQCENACRWAEDLVKAWLETNMFSGDPNPKQTASEVTDKLIDYGHKVNHGKHLSIDEVREKVGLVVEQIENCQHMQDLILTVHHTYMHTLSNSNAVKIIENHNGAAIVELSRIPS